MPNRGFFWILLLWGVHELVIPIIWREITSSRRNRLLLKIVNLVSYHGKSVRIRRERKSEVWQEVTSSKRNRCLLKILNLVCYHGKSLRIRRERKSEVWQEVTSSRRNRCLLKILNLGCDHGKSIRSRRERKSVGGNQIFLKVLKFGRHAGTNI